MKSYLCFMLGISFLMAGCAVTGDARQRTRFSLQGGYGYGGIVENTDLSLVPDAEATPESTADAYSGATIGGPNLGVHINKPLRYGEIETGADYIYNYQTFTYADQGNMYIGSRQLYVNQILLPLTYNIVLFKKSLPHADIQLKFGILGQYNLISVSDIGLTPLPGYSINKLSGGATLGISAYPVKFSNSSKLGFYLDAYRGSRIYTDYYNQESFEMPGSAFIKIGLRYQLKPY